jgi:hypothetical protein
MRSVVIKTEKTSPTTNLFRKIPKKLLKAESMNVKPLSESPVSNSGINNRSALRPLPNVIIIGSLPGTQMELTY